MFRNFGYSITINENRPLSRGTLALQSADPRAPPLIDPNYGAETREIERLVRGIKLARRVLAQPAFDAHRDVELAPRPQVQSDLEPRPWVRHHHETLSHPAGTFRMGNEGQKNVGSGRGVAFRGACGGVRKHIKQN